MNQPFTAWNDLCPELARLWITDPMEATRTVLRIQSAALDTIRESTEQAVHMGRKTLDTWISTMDAFAPKRTGA